MEDYKNKQPNNVQACSNTAKITPLSEGKGKTGMLTRPQCAALRGLAILGIVLHNYCHWLSPIIKENEYTFSRHNVTQLIQVVQHPDLYFPLHLLSFFGHYGVPIFLFLSAYGLVRKYEMTSPNLSEGREKNQETSSKKHLHSLVESWGGSFIYPHFLKLFKLMMVGFVAFTIVDSITPGTFHYQLGNVLAQLAMISNLFPHPDKVIWPGPYWFFGLMLQLYCVYRLLLYRRHWGFTVALIAICWLLQTGCQPDGETLNRLRYNFIGGVLPFGAGLLYARWERPWPSVALWTILILSSVAVVSFSINYQSWFWVPLFVCAFAVSGIRFLPRWLTDPLSWMGGISAALFVCHPITRKIFIPMSHRGDVYSGLLLFLIASVSIAWLFRALIKRISNPKL